MNTQIYDEASEWLIEFQTEQASASMRQRFGDWLNASPEHVRAYLELTSLWEDASEMDKRRVLDADALIASAMVGNIVPLAGVPDPYDETSVTSHGPWNQPGTARERRRVSALAASIALVGLSVIATFYWNASLRGVHSTEIGEQRTLALEDGTNVELNADTIIRERYTDKQRTVELVRGQAIFRVAKNPTRPFVVRSDTATVRAVGTQFDVHRRSKGTTVTVLEGRVAVVPTAKGNVDRTASTEDVAPGPAVPERMPASSSHAKVTKTAASTPTEIVLDAGEQLTVHAGENTAIPHRTDLDATIAWTQQRLVFESANLSDAAEEFNRFNTRKLVVDTKELDDFRVSGTFPALDPESLPRFVRFLRDQPGILVTESDDRINVGKNR